tara:strand:- start:119 stop:547 length:429 start_codon:yes stop_codon:yes gene_type:complete
VEIKLAKEYATLIASKRTLEAQLREVSDSMKRIERPLLEEMQDNEIDSLPIYVPDGRRITVYIHRQKWAKAKNGDRAAVVDALKMGGLTEFLSENYNTSTLSAFVREQDANGEILPECLTGVLDIGTVTSLRGRSSGATSED